MKVEIVTMGKIERKILSNMPKQIVRAFRPLRLIKNCKVNASLEIPKEAYNPKRNQYIARALLEYIRSKITLKEKRKVLTVTDKDLFSPGLNFIFGQAHCPGSFAIISLNRLDPEFYGQAADDDLFLKRVVKEAIHELGHTFGLRHCTNSKCVMSFSNSILDVDRKNSRFCEDCQKRLRI